MTDIKPDIKNELPLTINEKPLAAAEDLKERPVHAAESERLKNLEQAREMVMSEIARTTARQAAASAAPAAAAAQFKQRKQVENILARDLTEVYLSLSPEKRKEFKRAGEEIAGKINERLNQIKVKAGQIIKLIVKWLSLIPGVNKYFLEQEAKIKADELMKLRS